MYEPLRIIRGDDKIAVYCHRCNSEKGKYIRIMENGILNFDCNPNNKLNCSAFSVLMLHDLRYGVGQKVTVRLKGTVKGTAVVRVISTFTFDKINDHVSYLDSGCCVEKCRDLLKKKYRNRPGIYWETQLLDFVLFVYEEKETMKSLFR